MNTTDDTIEVTGISKSFGRRVALANCSFRVPEGRIAALVGPNGSGKTTLLRILAGLTTADAGSARINGAACATANAREDVAYLDQTQPLYHWWKVADVFEFVRRTNPRWNATLARERLDRLDIDPSRTIRSLSGGQRAQVSLTACFAKEPRVVLLDEPAASLDPLARQDLLRDITELYTDVGATVVMATHALGDVAAICDQIVILGSAQVLISEELEYFAESHRYLVADTQSAVEVPAGATVLDEMSSARERRLLVRLSMPVESSAWRVERPSLDETVLAYLRTGVSASTDPIGV